jgi:hypothetical protein
LIYFGAEDPHLMTHFERAHSDTTTPRARYSNPLTNLKF